MRVKWDEDQGPIASSGQEEFEAEGLGQCVRADRAQALGSAGPRFGSSCFARLSCVVFTMVVSPAKWR